MVYLLAMPGGWIADRLSGGRARRSRSAGAVIMTGHFMLAVPCQASFFGGLVLIAVGSGLLKANISTMVGHLYPDRNDPRRDGGFTIFYMGINLGAFAAPLVIGTVGQKVNWHLGFALAGVGMALGLLQYLLGTRHLAARSSWCRRRCRSPSGPRCCKRGGLWLAAAVVFYGIVDLHRLVHHQLGAVAAVAGRPGAARVRTSSGSGGTASSARTRSRRSPATSGSSWPPRCSG